MNSDIHFILKGADMKIEEYLDVGSNIKGFDIRNKYTVSTRATLPVYTGSISVSGLNIK